MLSPTLAVCALAALTGAAQPEPPQQPLTTLRASEPVTEPIAPIAKSVILIICDGMGPSMVSTVSEVTRAERGPLVMESMPVTGMVRTASLTGAITDSAAAATAYATGRKAHNGTVNWYPEDPTPSLAELAEESGRATGLLTTTNLTDATPASFIARAPKRSLHAGIFEQMVSSDVDLLVGGLRAAIIQTEGRPEGLTREMQLPLPESMQRTALVAGRLVLTGIDGVPDTTDASTRVLVAHPERTPQTDAFGPKLAESMSAALAMLGSDPDGFFLVAEVEETDNAGHGNDTDRVIAGLIEGDETLRVALAYQREHPDTLIVLTADHDTGSMSYDNQGDYRSPGGKVLWVSGNHTATRVPVFASGPGAHRFTGSHENTDLFGIIRELMGL